MKPGARSKTVAALASVALAAAVVGPVMAQDDEEPLNIWYVNPLPSFQAWGQSDEAFAEAADRIGYEATLVGPDTIDIPAMVGMMEEAIADGADGIITCSLDPAAFGGVIGQAQEAGITVVSIGCIDEQADYSVGTDNAAYGRLSADIIAEEVGPDANVVILGTARETPNQVAQVEAFRAQVAEKYPGITELAWETDNSDPAEAAEKLGAISLAYPEMDALWLIEGAAPGVVPQAFAEAGKAPGDVFVLSIDALDPTLAAIEDGWITTTLNQCYFWASPFAGELIKAAQAGEGPEQTLWSIDVDPVTADRLPYEGCPPEFIPTLASAE